MGSPELAVVGILTIGIPMLWMVTDGFTKF